jgi:hypothetical protein
MNRSVNRSNTNWKQEWEEETTLTPAEQRETDCLQREEEALNAQIMDDLRMLELERELNPKRGVSGWQHQEELYRRFDLDDGGWCLDDPLP